MPRRSVVTGMLLAAGSFAGSVLYRRRAARRRPRVDLYFEDGSVRSLPQGAPAGERLLALAREALEAAR